MVYVYFLTRFLIILLSQNTYTIGESCRASPPIDAIIYQNFLFSNTAGALSIKVDENFIKSIGIESLIIPKKDFRILTS